MYLQFREGLNSKPKFIKYGSKLPVSKKDQDYYVSLFQYTEEQKKQAEEAKTVSGIRDTSTDLLYFDFDSKSNLELAKQDALTLVHNLCNKYKVNPDNIQAYFTGSKGFAVEVKLNNRISNKQFKAAIKRLAGDLKTFDTVVSDPNRIIRITNTKHPKSGKYKIPLELWELDELSSDEIAKLADTERYLNGYAPKVVELPNELFQVKEEKESNKMAESSKDLKDILQEKPRHWKDYKWALAQGFFENGERHSALMVVAATCRGLGYDKDTAYYICKAALKKQAARTGQEEFDKEELYENIIEQSVYSDSWEGGSYSPQNNLWLKTYCERMGFETNQKDEDSYSAIKLHDMTDDFYKFSKDFENNILKTGIVELDNHVTLCTSTINGLLGQPGSGKTSMALNYLRNTSRNGISSMFFSLDMGKQLVFAKLVQKETGLDFKRALNLFKDDPEKAAKVSEKLKVDYKNVGFNFRSGLTVNDIRKAIRDHQAASGQKVKLVVIDYLECISSPISDPTAGSGLITNQLKDVANEEEVCILLLLQTQKHSTPDISDPLLSLKQIKGSSLTEQALSSILTLWRDGYNPKHVQDDRYISFAIVKNRFGGLWSGDFSWNGVTGDIRSLAQEEREELKEFRKRKAAEKAKADNDREAEWK